jgi:hypothetical protein
MPATRSLAVLAITLAGATLTLPLGAAQVASNTQKEVFSAIAVNTADVGARGTSRLEIVVNRYTSDAARDTLMAVFKEKGPEELLKALQHEPVVGRISSPGSLAYDLRYARQIPEAEGGRRVVLVTDRPIGFWEARNSGRTLDYPFTLIELRLDKDGKGEGKISVATKLTLNDNVLVIENYAAQPVMLTEVHKQ